MKKFRQDGFIAFSDIRIEGVLEKQQSKIEHDIQSKNHKQILSMDRESYIQKLVGKFSILPIQIHKDRLCVSHHEEMVPVDMHPNYFSISRGSRSSYPRQIIVYHLPFTGDKQLLKVKAGSYLSSMPTITVEDSCICFKIINFNDDAGSIKNESEQTIKSLETQNGHLTRDLNQFNSSIEQYASQVFDARKEQIIKNNDLVNSLGVPLKKT